MEAGISQIETRRLTMGITIERLCGAAGLTEKGYRLCAKGLREATPATLGKLNTALNRFRLGFGAEASEIAPHAAYKLCLIVAAFQIRKHLADSAGLLGPWQDALATETRQALTADPSRRANADPEWARAARVRQLGIWIANGQLGFKTSDLARAAGMTKQAISAATRAVEDDDDLAAVRAELEDLFR